MKLALSKEVGITENSELSHVIERVLTYILGKHITVIKPVLTPNDITYPAIDDVLEKLNATVPSYMILEALRERGLLEKKVIDRAIACPNCGALDVKTRYYCPNCGSFNLEKTYLVTHIDCGYTDAYVNFKSNSKLICPSCHKELKERELVRRDEFNEFFLCLDCNSRITEPEIKHECNSCHTVFSPLEADYIEVSEYYIKEREITEYKQRLVINTINNVLTKQGLRKTSQSIRGESGVVHTFDLVMSNGDGKIVFVCPEDKKGDELVRDMFTTFAKAVDIKDAKVVYVVPKESSQDLPNLKRSNWFTLVYKDLDDLKKKLSKILS